MDCGVPTAIADGLMGMCRWMWSYFHGWINNNGVAFLTEFPTELLEWGRKLSGFWGILKILDLVHQMCHFILGLPS